MILVGHAIGLMFCAFLLLLSRLGSTARGILTESRATILSVLVLLLAC